MPTTKRVLFTGPGQVVLEECEVGPPGPGQLLLRTERTLISTGTELTALSGDFPPGSVWSQYVRYPFPAGYSSAARVEAVGPGVEGYAPGDRVASFAPHAGWALHGTEHLWPVPEGVDPEAATFATLAEIAMGGVRRSRLTFGEAAVIVGAGLLGQLAAAFCRAAGAWPLIVVDPAQARLPLAQRMGATHVLAAAAADARPQVEEITRGQMAEVVIEVTGHPLAMPGAIRLARRLGRVVVLGSPRGPVTLDFHNEVHTLGIEIIGAHNMTHPPVETPNAPWTRNRHARLFLDWQAAGVVDVRPLITHRYPWQQAPDAFAMLLEDRSRAMGVVLDWST